MKKNLYYFSLLLGLVFGMTMLTACGGDDGEEIKNNTESSLSTILRANKWIGGDSDVTPTSYGGSISHETDIFYFLDGNQGYWRWISSEYDSSLGRSRSNGWEHFTYTILSKNTVKLVFDNGSADQVMIYSEEGLISESSTFRLRQVSIPADDEIYDFLKQNETNNGEDKKNPESDNKEQEGLNGDIPLCPDENHPHMIDLGLPSGTKWACCNLGASQPEGYGGYYAWGETTTKSSYTLNNYKYYKNGSYVDIGSNIAGTKYDAATANWGAKWQMPTYVQSKELFDNTTLEWITMNGTNGIKLVGKNRNSIFLPEAGNWEESLNSAGKAGYYTTASFYERNGSYTSNYAALVCFHDGEIIWGSHGSRGVSIRPVSKK